MTEPGSKWACEYCTYENWPSAIKCTMCRAARPGGTIITEEPFKSGWARKPWPGWGATPPSRDVGMLICPDQIADEAVAKWSCHICTYLNWPRAVRCTQCLCQRSCGPVEVTQTPGPVSQPPTSPSPPLTDFCAANNDRNKPPARELHCTICEPSEPGTLEQTKHDCSLAAISERDQQQGCCSGEQRGSASNPESQPAVTVDFQRIELAAASSSSGNEGVKENNLKELKLIQNRLRKTDLLFLNACVGVVEGVLAPVEAYKSSGGDTSRQLTAEEAHLLNRPSAFDEGFTLVHLAIRFQRQDMLAVLLTEVSGQAAKRIPAMVSLELTEQIRREVAASLHQRKGDFACYFLADLVTFTLPADIEDLPTTVQEKLFDEVLDRDVQKELEEESPIINWSLELGSRLDSRLYALWNRTAGDCLLDSVLQATWGIYDKDSVLRKTLHDSLHDCSHWFYMRWKEWESWYSQSCGLQFSLREEQWQEDWAFILSLASQPGASLEQTHIFVLAHIFRRPIIVYGVKYYKSFRGEALGYTRFQGVYLPLLWEQSFCWKNPIALGYTRGHFTALVAMENDGYDSRGAGANPNVDDDVTVIFLPLVDSDRKLLHVHFLSAPEMGSEERQERLLREWLDCCVTEGGLLVALQKSSRRSTHPLVAQMLDRWLDGYRQIRPHAALSDGEEDDEDDET
ncbi:ubiquitin thioesterase ZRANB1-like [Brienomyrus brachyistius]|uniref:ubiquitin thioesterase ZRANB1-like n=1 Tax=Brienomyrus brachyistius TaxID=42636 RepID=UPI0020B35F24|nr:ubiquitin thioesterase ZRANB1-like [Brienomyrus brachyistius]XP_048865354.1 ubiquitin thioesterase ZRANB1-like [Brienomyrus brachyistius]